jgi:signal transduction histidine kinase
VTDQDLNQRLAFLGWSAEDEEALRRLRPLVEEHADRLVASFYRHLLSFEPTRALLSDPQVKTRLLQKQREYLVSLTAAEFGDAYESERLGIGETHLRVGLEPRWYLGAYSLYMSLLVPLIGEHYRSEPGRSDRAVSALVKVLMLDAQLAMEAYMGRRQEQLEYLTRELAESSRHLERTFEEQSHELRETTERARAAEQLAAISTLVAGLAHEIGTPMGVIQGHAEMLQSSVNDERGRWRLQTIREQIERISRIIQTLLNIAKPRPPQRAPVELRETLQGCIDFLAVKLQRRHIRVESDLSFAAILDGDREKLQQLFLNLFLNAADAMPEGGQLGIAMGAVPAGEAGEGGGVELRISDSGLGIPESALARVFEPFFTTKPAGEGSGLGLMVAKGIVDQHGGDITVHSEEGKGTEFRIHLPGARPEP